MNAGHPDNDVFYREHPVAHAARTDAAAVRARARIRDAAVNGTEITARFNGTCAACGRRTAAGQRVRYRPGRGVIHLDCGDGGPKRRRP